MVREKRQREGGEPCPNEGQEGGLTKCSNTEARVR